MTSVTTSILYANFDDIILFYKEYNIENTNNLLENSDI